MGAEGSARAAGAAVTWGRSRAAILSAERRWGPAAGVVSSGGAVRAPHLVTPDGPQVGHRSLVSVTLGYAMFVLCTREMRFISRSGLPKTAALAGQ